MKARKFQLMIGCALVLSGSFAFAQESEPAEPASAELEARVDALEAQLEEMEATILETQALAQRSAPTFDGYSKLSFEVDGLTGGTALTNENEIEIRVPLASGTSVQRYRGDAMTAMISLYGVNIAGTDTGLNVNPGRFDAQLLWGDYYLNISRAPEFLLDKAQPIDSFGTNVRMNSVVAEGGLSVGMSGRGQALELRVGSYQDDARYNYKNQYGFGINWEQRLIPQLLNIEAGASYGMQLGYIRDESSSFTSRDVGLSIKPIIFLQGLGDGIRLDLASDLLMPYDVVNDAYLPIDFDARFDTELFLSAEGTLPGGTRDRSSAKLALYSAPLSSILDFEMALSELPGDLGFLPLVGGNLTVVLGDILGTSGTAITIGGRLDATFGTITPYVESTYRTTTGDIGLTLGTLVQPLEKVKLEIVYNSKNIRETDSTIDGALGTLKVATTIEY